MLQRFSTIFLSSLLFVSSISIAQPPQSSQVDRGTSGTIPQSGAPTTTAHGSSIAGCLTGSNGSFQLKDDDTGTQYSLQGNTSSLSGMTGRIVQLQGNPSLRQGVSGQQIYQISSANNTGQPCPQNTSDNAKSQKPGAPSNSSEIGRNSADAQRISDYAHSTEIGAQTGTYGVNGKEPANSGNQTSGPSGAVANPSNARGLEGSTSISIGAPQSGVPETSLIGCLSGSDQSWKLKSGSSSYNLTGAVENLNILSGHSVQINGSMSGHNFEVKSVKDVATKCE